MAAIIPAFKLDNDSALARRFLPYQVAWILDDARLCLAEKSVRIGWTYADAFKNVRLRLRQPRRDYLFTTKDEATAIEYVQTCARFCEWYGRAGDIVTRGLEALRLPGGTGGTSASETRAGMIKFSNGSRILAFSSNPNALRAYGGDVGMDEFAFHPDAPALWAAASGRATWGYNLAVWSSHSGSQTLFYRFAQEAAAGQGGWRHYRVTMPDAITLGLVEKINAVTGARFTRESFLEDCRTRARLPEVFAQEYLCQPADAVNALVPWAALERCQMDYALERRHLEETDVAAQFGEFNPAQAERRETAIRQFLRAAFATTFAAGGRHMLGFDVAASGAGDLAVFYLDRVTGAELRLAALLTCRTQDWHFLKTALAVFLRELPAARGAGDETGLGRQICWEAARNFPGRFTAVNFAREKMALGFRLLEELSAGAKRFPRGEPDIAADYFALRKLHRGGRWTFAEGPNPLNPHSHCDLAWAGALSSWARAKEGQGVQAFVLG
jgi:phage FluMu gp28-like protein